MILGIASFYAHMRRLVARVSGRRSPDGVDVLLCELVGRIGMAKPKLFSTHALFEGPRRRIAERFDAEYWTAPDRPPARRCFGRWREKTR